MPGKRKASMHGMNFLIFICNTFLKIGLTSGIITYAENRIALKRYGTVPENSLTDLLEGHQFY